MKNIFNISGLSLIDGQFFFKGIKVDTININQTRRHIYINLVYIEDITKAIEIAKELDPLSTLGCELLHYPKTDKTEERYIINTYPDMSNGLFVCITITGKDNDPFHYDLEYAKKIGDSLTIEA